MGQGHAEWRRELGAMVVLALPVVLSELGWMAQGAVDTIMAGIVHVRRSAPEGRFRRSDARVVGGVKAAG
jgi:Na+-driven multidrug efflux pump